MLTLKRDDIKVGTTLYLFGGYGKDRTGEEITITKVGRNYAYFGNRNLRLDLEIMKINSSRFSIYDSKDAYEISLKIGSDYDKLESFFRSNYGYGLRCKVSHEKVLKILNILGLDDTD